MDLPLRPLSQCYGYDRGTPVDRPYIADFLTAHADLIRGDAAEVKNDTYLRRYGGNRLTSTTIIDVDPANPAATLLADLATPDSLPAARFDCIVLTQTLQLLPDPAQTINACAQALKPSGALLVTVPAVARISPSGGDADRWRFTPAGLRQLFAGWHGEVSVTGYGNLRTCLAALLGEATEELHPGELNHHDPHFPLTVCAAARRRTA
ncbi:methyltransferase domain-containing protein [Dactylosporangium sp. NPDC051485]|uniref:class I SAM-dependent methyltransferase n=1 Tax=Dactylosporangium sp. NPDC051485 TaxID=3154846 RepID=UPI0034272BC1